MDQDHKTMLRKTLVSQTWNVPLTKAVITAIEEDQMRPKLKTKPSALEIAVRNEKRINSISQTSVAEDTGGE